MREAVTTRAHTEEMLAEAGADITVEPWGEGRVVTRARPRAPSPSTGTVPGDPSAAGFFVVAGCVVPGSAVEVAGVYSGPARLGFVVGPRSAWARAGHPRAGRARAPRPSGRRAGPAARHRGAGRARSPRSTRSRSSPWPPPSPRGRPSSPTWASCGSRRSTGWPRVADMVEAFGARPRGRRRHAGHHRRRRARCAAARFDSRGDHRMAMAAAVAALAAGPGERSLITGFAAVDDQLPRLRRRPRTPDRRSRPGATSASSPSTAPPAPASRPSRGRGRASGARPPRHRRHVPGRGRPRARARHRPRRRRRGGGTRRGGAHRGRAG